jgi:chemotaxis protein methyltransferase CheR
LNKIFNHTIFICFRDFIHQNYGIYYSDSKKELLKLKIDRCILRAKIDTYDEYFKLLKSNTDSLYLSHFLDEITVNKTEFFREIEHYNYIHSNIQKICKENPNILKNKEIKVWSMACSTGQEAYTCAMVLKEVLPPEIRIRILATDISSKVLKIAKEGIYPKTIKNGINPHYFKKYFKESDDYIEVAENIKDLVIFRKFNLVQSFPFESNFDIIFCRNVMIYFNLETQQQIIDKIYKCLTNGGLLLIGQSESLLNKNHLFVHIKSTIYKK